MYFGFTHCPDVCPTDLAVIGQALRRFEKSDPARAARVAPIFVSVDPERDTPAVLKDYVAAFHPRLVGLTGTPQQIADMAKRYGVYYAKEAGRRRRRLQRQPQPPRRADRARRASRSPSSPTRRAPRRWPPSSTGG